MATNVEKDVAVELELVKGQIGDVLATGNVGLVDGNGHANRVPVPSADPNDPLNMSRWRKLGVIVTCCWFSIFSLVLVGGAGPVIPVWIEMYTKQGVNPQAVINLSTYPSLVMCFGSFLILPLSIMYGRRPVVLGCCLLILGSTIGAAKSTSFNTHMACRILQGLATGATESVLPLIISDITFIDERGLFFGWYWGIQNTINAIFNITVGYLVADLGWRYYYWVLAVLCGFGTLVTFFCLPESRYSRSPIALNGEICCTDEFGVTQILAESEARQRYGDSVLDTDHAATTEKRSYVSSLKLVSSIAPNPGRAGLSALTKMVRSLSSPGVVWAIMATSIILGVGISMTLTYGTLLTESFGWSYASVGLINCGIFPAALCAMFWAGWLGDRVNLWLAKHRGGTHLPEDTLVIIIIPTIISAIGIVVYAVTADEPGSHSSWGLIVGWTLFEFGFIVCLISTTHFAAEAYPANPGPALVTVVGLKNLVSFGASFGIVPMVYKFNYLTAYMILFGIFCAIFLLGIPVYFLNPKWRAMEAKRQKRTEA